MKKNKNTKNVMSDFVTGIQVGCTLFELLEYESRIDLKKKLGQKLNDKEYFFDNYMIKPSTLYRCLKKGNK